MEELSRGSGKDFDPSVVDAFKRSFRENPNAFAKIVNLSSTAKSQDLEVLF
jgi:HD-GYP domain-containing protein (c-di-GMP phosphodiesterase class II)